MVCMPEQMGCADHSEYQGKFRKASTSLIFAWVCVPKQMGCADDSEYQGKARNASTSLIFPCICTTKVERQLKIHCGLAHSPVSLVTPAVSIAKSP